MSVKLIIVSMCAVCLLASSVVLAQQTGQQPGQQSGQPAGQQGKPVRDFNTADINKDGKVTLDEFLAHTGLHPEKAKKAFNKYDQGNKGHLTQDEFNWWSQEENFADTP